MGWCVRALSHLDTVFLCWTNTRQELIGLPFKILFFTGCLFIAVFYYVDIDAHSFERCIWYHCGSLGIPRGRGPWRSIKSDFMDWKWNSKRHAYPLFSSLSRTRHVSWASVQAKLYFFGNASLHYMRLWRFLCQKGHVLSFQILQTDKLSRFHWIP